MGRFKVDQTDSPQARQEALKTLRRITGDLKVEEEVWEMARQTIVEEDENDK